MSPSPLRARFVATLSRAFVALAMLAGLTLAPVGTALAQDHPAQALVKDAVDQVIVVLDTRADELAEDPELLARTVDQYIVPYVDFNTMTKLAVGKFWRQADAAQKTELVTEFKSLLMNTYAGALKEYEDATISFEPFRPEKRDDRAVVRSTYRQAGTGDVPVQYKLREKDGWSIYDIEVNNISLVTSYRTAFANEISRGGIEGLLATLKERNRKKS